MTQRGPYYRGRNAIDLARTQSIESIGGAPLDVSESSAFVSAMPAVPAEFQALQALLKHTGSVDVCDCAFSLYRTRQSARI